MVSVRKLDELESRRKEREERKKNKCSPSFTKLFMTRSKARDECCPQSSQSMNNECTTCFGEYKDDLSDGVPIKSWIQCTVKSAINGCMRNVCRKYRGRFCVYVW